MESWARKSSEGGGSASSNGAVAVRPPGPTRGKGKGKSGKSKKPSKFCDRNEAKRSRYEPSRRNEFQALRHLSMTTACLSLQTARIARLLYAQAVITIFMLTNTYTDALEEVSEDPLVLQKPALQHVQRWGALMLAIKENPKVAESVRTIVSNHIASSPVREQLLPHIQLCTCQPFKEDPGMHLIQLRVSSDFHHIAAQVLQALVAAGGTMQFDVKSRTGLERATQDALDAVRAYSS
eukprot:TRINITY_DN64311_c0_g1_i1.p1 TRINITY_DN64311_c0_g1~~TRINITY_DN64311_c0_g1_i1.p1  ORF type:complete len:237 (+),score=25.27 TRINITY_DN64311_c0_g1_i1:82-792(+)